MGGGKDFAFFLQMQLVIANFYRGTVVIILYRNHVEQKEE